MKNKEDIEIRKVLAGIKRNMDKKVWDCMVSGCNQKAINSHLLQRRGILSYIVENGHCYELKETDVFSWTRNTHPVELKRCGVQNAISLHMFCNHHDTEIFKPIESGAVDYDDYYNQLLLSFRSICAEIRKKEIIIERGKRCLESRILQAYRGDSRDLLLADIRGNEIGIRDLFFYKDLVEKELKNPDGGFLFVHYRYPIQGLYASASFTISDLEESVNMSDVLPNCIGHIIPGGECSEFIFGYHKKHVNNAIIEFVNGWSDLKGDSLGRKITGWFTLIDGWGISPSLFKRIKTDDLEYYYKLLNDSSFDLNQNPNVGFNLFAGLL